MIMGGDLTPGARLGEVELADRLGVSRTPVREALSRLAAEGLVEIAPNRGARVATWTVAELEGVFELRSVLEPQLTAHAVPNATPADVDELDDLAGRMHEVGSPGPGQDLDALVPLNRAFHDRLVTLAAHPTLATALAAAIHPPIVRRNFLTYAEASLRRSLAHHRAIVAPPPPPPAGPRAGRGHPTADRAPQLPDLRRGVAAPQPGPPQRDRRRPPRG